ncbi:MAG: PAS domain S-box protein [Gammaproteobacteria bacterium]
MTEKDGSTLTIAPVPRYTLIWVGVLIGVAFYLSDALLDTLLFNAGPLTDQLLHPTWHELWMRLIVLVFSTSFGIYAFTVLKREQATSVRAHKAERRLQVLFNSAAEFIFLIDAEGTILRANQNVLKISGYSEDEVIGRNIKTFFSTDSQHTCDCNFPTLREKGYTRSEIDFVNKDGSIINMECSATAVPDEHGDYTSFLIIQRDISERLRAARELEESERRFRAIFNSTYQFIGLLKPDGTILEANQTALDFIGLTNADVVGKPFWETPWWTHSPQLQKRLRERLLEAAQGKQVRFEAEHVGKNGQRIDVDFSLKPVLNEQGEIVLLIPEGHDISERKHAEENALRMQQESAHMMRVNIMGEMASGMAHELNQPLTALVSYCGTALKMVRETATLPEGLVDILERASGQAHRAGDVIHHLREFVSKGNNDKSRVILDDLVQGVIDFISWELRNSDIHVTFLPASFAREVSIDKVQIEQVLINLIRNSIEAISQAGISGGRVDIASRPIADGSIEVSVADNGPGIDPEVADSLFEPYQTSKETGMGMGLSISRSIIEAHDGKLWVERLQPGAVFCLSLPQCH